MTIVVVAAAVIIIIIIVIIIVVIIIAVIIIAVIIVVICSHDGLSAAFIKGLSLLNCTLSCSFLSSLFCYEEMVVASLLQSHFTCSSFSSSSSSQVPRQSCREAELWVNYSLSSNSIISSSPISLNGSSCSSSPDSSHSYTCDVVLGECWQPYSVSLAYSNSGKNVAGPYSQPFTLSRITESKPLQVHN